MERGTYGPKLLWCTCRAISQAISGARCKFCTLRAQFGSSGLGSTLIVEVIRRLERGLEWNFDFGPSANMVPFAEHVRIIRVQAPSWVMSISFEPIFGVCIPYYQGIATVPSPMRAPGGEWLQFFSANCNIEIRSKWPLALRGS